MLKFTVFDLPFFDEIVVILDVCTVMWQAFRHHRRRVVLYRGEHLVRFDALAIEYTMKYLVTVKYRFIQLFHKGLARFEYQPAIFPFAIQSLLC